MIRKIAFALALAFAASIFVQVIAVSQADCRQGLPLYVVGQEEGLQVLRRN